MEYQPNPQLPAPQNHPQVRPQVQQWTTYPNQFPPLSQLPVGYSYPANYITPVNQPQMQCLIQGQPIIQHRQGVFPYSVGPANSQQLSASQLTQNQHIQAMMPLAGTQQQGHGSSSNSINQQNSIIFNNKQSGGSGSNSQEGKQSNSDGNISKESKRISLSDFDLKNSEYKENPFDDDDESKFLEKVIREFELNSGTLIKHAMHLIFQKYGSDFVHQYFRQLKDEENLKNKPFTKQEDRLLMKSIKKYGRSWKKISKIFQNNRDAITLKNRHYYLVKKGLVDKKTDEWILNSDQDSDNSLIKASKDILKPTKISKKVKAENEEQKSSSSGSGNNCVESKDMVIGRVSNEFNSSE